MKSKTKNTEENNKAFAVGSREGLVLVSVPYTQEDLKNTVLIVSVLINLAFLILWILMQLDSRYVYQVAGALLQ